MSWLTFPRLIFLSVLLRLALFFHGLHQDAHSTLKYTDIDYYVFTDAARYLAQGLSPYRRDTFRYTPILAYVLYPTTIWFNFGKFLFATADVVAGWGIYRILMLSRGMEEKRAVWYTACCWLLNPIVATISTRGSSEGLLGVIVIGLLWATMSHRIVTAGALLGFATHFKIYPIIYAPAILLWLDSTPTTIFTNPTRFLCQTITRNRIVFALSALGTFFGLNFALYYVYGHEFLHHTYLHHFVRLDHRHNFSPYNVLLYLVSSPTGRSEFPFAKWAFLPQMFLSAVAVPLVGARKDLPGTMFLQTFAFVAFNKVCTSQYFMWYIVLLPFILPYSKFLKTKRRGIKALVLWVLGQAAWLQQGYALEFLGTSTFFPGLWVASLGFFGINCWILGEFVNDVNGLKGDCASVKPGMGKMESKSDGSDNHVIAASSRNLKN